MKIKELIDRLIQFPSDYEIQVHYEVCCSSEIEDSNITEDKNNKIVWIDLDRERDDEMRSEK